jgi:hypothetical protein
MEQTYNHADRDLFADSVHKDMAGLSVFEKEYDCFDCLKLEVCLIEVCDDFV